MDIITGYTGSPHVTAEQDRDVNIGIFGAESYVLRTGSQLKAEVSSNNEIKVRDGVIMHQGCAASIKKNTYDSLTIANGSQGMKRVDLIVARYSRDQNTKEESLVLKVIQGTPKESGPAVPGYTIGDIQAGDLIADMPLYQVTLNGLNITEVKQLFATQDSIAELSSNLVKTAVYMNNGAYNIAPSNSEFQGTDFSKKILDNIGLVHNYDSTNYKHTFTVPQDGIYLIHAYMNFQQGVTKQLSLYAKLERNNVEQSRQSKLIGPYNGADFMFLNEINAGDKIRFTVLQSSGSVIQVSGGCRLNIIRMGK